MNASIIQGLAAGVLIGTGFAWLQLQGLRRNERLRRQEKMPTYLRMLPGSGGRVACLLLALVAAQVLLPNADKWWLTGSLAVTVAVPTIWRLIHKSPQAVI